MAERAEVGERRVGHDGAHARVLGGGEQGDGAAQREAEHADGRDPPRVEEVQHALEVAALAQTQRGGRALAGAEVALIHQQRGELRRQRGGDRQQVGLLGRIAVEQDDGRRARPRREPAGQPHAVVGADGDVLDAQPVVVGAKRDGQARRPHRQPEAGQADHEEGDQEDAGVEREPHGAHDRTARRCTIDGCSSPRPRWPSC